MEIRIVEITNGYLVYSDRAKLPLFIKLPHNVEVCVSRLAKEWATQEIQKGNE